MEIKEETKTTNTDLVKITTGLEAFETRKAEFELLLESAKTITVKSVDDKESYKLVVLKRKELKAARVKVEKEGKDMRDVLTPISRNISTKEKELVSIIDKEEDRLEKEEKWFEAEVERIKKEEEEKEKLRIQERLSQFARYGYAIDYVEVLAMSDETFNTRIEDVRLAWTIEQQKAEFERLKKEGIEQLHKERQVIVLDYFDVAPVELRTMQLGEIHDVDWNNIVENLKETRKKIDDEKQIEAARLKKVEEDQKREREELEKQKEEQRIAQEEIDKQRTFLEKQLKEARYSHRKTILLSSGWFSGSAKFIKEGFVFEEDYLISFSDDQFSEQLSLFERGIEIKIAEEEQLKLDAETAKLKAERKRKALLPDKKRLIEYIEVLEFSDFLNTEVTPVPEFKNKEAKDCLDTFLGVIKKAISDHKTNAEQL